MAELLSHLLVVWAVLTVASWRLEWLTSRWIAVGVVGGILPDLNRLAIAVPERAIADFLGASFQVDAFHTLGGITVLAGIGAVMFAQNQRRAFGLLFAGAFVHLLTDAVKSYADGQAAMWLYPLTSYRHPTPNLYVSADPEVLALTFGIAGVVFVIDRWQNVGSGSTASQNGEHDT
ncbi:metal-dependent hydrolase [Halobacteria archaeon AArc-m2/3/4]|uniref:Metal-dependent hydrolase n=1 Tax=Natronoglomus mannanivorans TaxID=2979990 RepID=A0ABT2QJ74_9EURY|nr:metal-dependent hydrolase [Halobacteria archaeon AArc-m2/3/4]